MALVADRFAVVVVGSPERCRPRGRFEVDAAASRGAVVDHEARELGPQVVPESVEPFDVADFADAHAVGLVVGVPETFGVDVEILPVVVDAIVADELGDLLAEPREGHGVAQVEEERIDASAFHPARLGRLAAGVEHELGVLHGPVGILHHALGLEPHHELAAGAVDLVGHGAEALREAYAVHRPVAHGVGPVVVVLPVGGLAVPSGVEPEDLRQQIELLVAFHEGRGVIGCHAGVFVAGGGIAVVEARTDREHGGLAVGRGVVVGQQEAAQKVLTVHTVVTLPQEHGRRRSADLLARKQVSGQVLHAGRHADGICRRACDVGSPVTGPSDGYDHASRGQLDVEKGKGVRRRASALRVHRVLVAYGQLACASVKVGLRDVASVGVVEQVGSLGCRFGDDVHDLHLLDLRGVPLGGVAEAEHPLHGVEIRKSLHAALDGESRRGVGIGVDALGDVPLRCGERLGGVFPVGDRLARGHASVDEREGRHLAFGESSGDPFFTFGAFGGNAQARLGGGLCNGQQECCEQ